MDATSIACSLSFSHQTIFSVPSGFFFFKKKDSRPLADPISMSAIEENNNKIKPAPFSFSPPPNAVADDKGGRKKGEKLGAPCVLCGDTLSGLHLQTSNRPP